MKEKEQLTLNDLTATNTGNLQEVDPTKLKGSKKTEETNVLFTDAFGSLSGVTERIAREAEEFHIQKAEFELEEELTEEEDIEDVDVEEDDTYICSEKSNSFMESVNPKANIKVPPSIIDVENEEEDEDDDEDSENKDTEEARFNEMQSLLKETIKPITNKIDISSFKISKKPVSVVNALKTTNSSKNIVDWALFSSNKGISMTEFSGFEIEKLNPKNSTRNKLNTFTDIYNLIFSHIVDNNKPFTMEEWVKGIPFYDQNHLYFAIYKASYDKANYIPYDCPHCKNVFVTKDIAIEDMVKYKDKNAENKAKTILANDTTSESNEYDVDLVQVSDNYVIGFKDPSIYNIIFENVILDDKFVNKQAELLQVMAYIDSIYFIDMENGELRPIEVKVHPNNMIKTIKEKITKYAKVIQSLSSDQYNQLDKILRERDERHEDIYYVLPKCKCTKCGKDIDERPMTSEDMLFTRHQLARIANI